VLSRRTSPGSSTTGGVYLGGGIAATLLGPSSEASQAWQGRARSLFLEGFLEKGRLRPLLETLPVRVIPDDPVGELLVDYLLLGLARLALDELRLVALGVLDERLGGQPVRRQGDLRLVADAEGEDHVRVGVAEAHGGPGLELLVLWRIRRDPGSQQDLVECTESSGATRDIAGDSLDRDTSASLFERRGQMRKIDVFTAPGR
jgi:hypothetical protein